MPTITTERLTITIDANGVLIVTDKQTGRVWEQAPQKVPHAYAITDIEARTSDLSYLLDGRLRVHIHAQGSEFVLTITGNADESLADLAYPSGFRLAGSHDQRLVLPNGAGLVVPFALRDAPHLQVLKRAFSASAEEAGLTMPWIGITDGEAGALMEVLTPYDAAVRIGADDLGYTAAVAWLDSKGRMAYDRRVRFSFVDSGGYVALCKIYRQHVIEEGGFVSLREKAEGTPAIHSFLGAMNLWLTDWPDPDFFTMIKAAGIERALVNFHVGRDRIPPDHAPRPGRYPVYEPMDRAFVEHLHSLGYLAGRMDYYRTIYPPSRQDNQWIMRQTGYPEQAAVDEHGDFRPGFGSKAGDPEPLLHRCAHRQYEMARVSMVRDVEAVGYDARFVDTLAAVGWHECYSPYHPVTRSEDMAYRFKILALMRDLGLVNGTENLTTWTIPAATYGEGPTTFASLTLYPFKFRWRLMPEPIEVTQQYRDITLNETLRAPLWQLVFHDAAVITSRWDHTPNRYADKRDWDKETLFYLLDGDMPTMLTDKTNFEANRDRFIRTSQTVCAWNAQTGFEEMVDHRALTEDGRVQQVTYASGHQATVNFGAEDAYLDNGARVPARDALTHAP